MGILDDLYGYNSGRVQSNTLMANPNYSAGKRGDTVGGIGNASGMGLDINWGAPTTQTLAIGDVFSTPAGDYQAVDNGYGQIGLVPLGGAIQTGSDIQYNVAQGDHHYGVNPNTGEAWYQKSKGPSASLYSTEYDVEASNTFSNTSPNTFSNTSPNTFLNTSSQAGTGTTEEEEQDSTGLPPVVDNASSNTSSAPQYTAADVNALYNQYLNRDADEAGLNYWLNSLNSGASMQDVIYNIIQSDEYKTLQGNGSDENVLTAAGLANALSMLIPQSGPPPPSVVGPSSGGSFNTAPVQRLSFSNPELAPIRSSNQIDYVKQMRAGLFKDLV